MKHLPLGIVLTALLCAAVALAQSTGPEEGIGAAPRGAFASVLPLNSNAVLNCHNKSGSSPSVDWYSQPLGSSSPIDYLPVSGCADNDQIIVYAVQGASGVVAPTFTNSTLPLVNSVAFLNDSAKGVAASTSVTTTAMSVTAGNALIFTVAADTANNPTVTSSPAQTWSECPSGTVIKDPGNTASVSIWYTTNVTGGSTTATATYGGNEDIAVDLAQFSGLQATPLDVCSAAGANSNSVSGTALSSGTTGATGSNFDLLIAVADLNGNATLSAGPTNGFTALTSIVGDTAASIFPAWKTVTANGNYSTAWTVNTSGLWAGTIVALKGNSSTGSSNIVGTCSPTLGTTLGNSETWTFKWDQANSKWITYCGGTVDNAPSISGGGTLATGSTKFAGRITGAAATGNVLTPGITCPNAVTVALQDDITAGGAKVTAQSTTSVTFSATASDTVDYIASCR